jgi:hypothetical protein
MTGWLNSNFKEFAQRCADKCSRHLSNLLLQEVIRFTGSQVGLCFPQKYSQTFTGVAIHKQPTTLEAGLLPDRRQQLLLIEAAGLVEPVMLNLDREDAGVHGFAPE